MDCDAGKVGYCELLGALESVIDVVERIFETANRVLLHKLR